MKKNRLVIFDALKVFSTLLVINLHYEMIVLVKPLSVLSYLGWYAVPLFIMISFYFNSKYFFASNSSPQIFICKLKRFLIPLLFWSCVGFILQPSLISFKHLLRQLLFGTVVDVPLYYLNMMIIFILFCYLLNSWLKKYYQPILFISLFFFLVIEITNVDKFIVGLVPYNGQFFVIRFIEFYKYVVLGLFLPVISNNLRRIHFINWIVLGLFALFTTLDISQQWQKQSNVIIYSGILQFLSVGLLILFLSINQNLKITYSLSKAIHFLTKYTLGVYCLHFFFVQNLKILLQNFHLDYQQYHFAIVILIFIICLSISVFIDKISFGRLSLTVS